jgi:hypothetical protein
MNKEKEKRNKSEIGNRIKKKNKKKERKMKEKKIILESKYK